MNINSGFWEKTIIIGQKKYYWALFRETYGKIGILVFWVCVCVCGIDKLFWTQTMVFTGAICENHLWGLLTSQVEKCCTNPTPFSGQAWLQVPHRRRTNRKDHPVNKLSCCYLAMQRLTVWYIFILKCTQPILTKQHICVSHFQVIILKLDIKVLQI